MGGHILHYYAADQDPVNTSSKGIYNVTRCLLRALAATQPGDWKILVSVNPRYREGLVPDPCPEWIEVVEVQGNRLWLDHMWCPWFTNRSGAAAVMYPKGFVSLFRPKRARILSIVYDCMNDFYAETYPKKKPLKVRYFRSLLKMTLMRSEVVFTISEFSRKEIQRRYRYEQKIDVLPMGNTLEEPAVWMNRTERKGFLVFGTSTPHKRTRETLELFQEYRQRMGETEPLYLVGFAEFPAELMTGVLAEGTLSADALSKRLGSVKAVIFLSEMEGFGLPILEAYAHGTPVVFRNRHAFREILGDAVPGAWDGEGPETFVEACQSVLSMKEEQIEKFHADLKRRYNWEAAGELVRKRLMALQGLRG